MVHIQVLELTDEPVPVTIVAVDDNVYEGTELIYLRLTETDSSNDVTRGLVHPSIAIILEDNDSMLLKQPSHYVYSMGSHKIKPSSLCMHILNCSADIADTGMVYRIYLNSSRGYYLFQPPASAATIQGGYYTRAALISKTARVRRL